VPLNVPKPYENPSGVQGNRGEAMNHINLCKPTWELNPTFVELVAVRTLVRISPQAQIYVSTTTGLGK